MIDRGREQHRDREIGDRAQLVDHRELRRPVAQADLGEAEEAQDPGDGRGGQGPALPHRQGAAAGACGDEAQHADILLLEVPELPGEEGGQGPAAQRLVGELEQERAADDEQERDDDVTPRMLAEVRAHLFVAEEPAARGDVEIVAEEVQHDEGAECAVGVGHDVLGEGDEYHRQDRHRRDQHDEGLPRRGVPSRPKGVGRIDDAVGHAGIMRTAFAGSTDWRQLIQSLGDVPATALSRRAGDNKRWAASR